MLSGRLEKLVATLKAAGFKAQMPGGTYFLYVPAPKGLADGTKQFVFNGDFNVNPGDTIKGVGSSFAAFVATNNANIAGATFDFSGVAPVARTVPWFSKTTSLSFELEPA